MAIKILGSILVALAGVVCVINYDPSTIVLPPEDVVALHHNNDTWMQQYLANLTALSYYLRSQGIDHDLISYKVFMPNT
ncbi:hypothetical protein V1515DRAFT_609607 [Lipomyces mesembrius]